VRSSFSSRFTIGLTTALLSAASLGCTEPQSGLLTKTWCQPQAAGTVLLDDMEDGDSAPCEPKAGQWMVYSNGDVMPTSGQAAVPVDLLDGDPARSRMFPSFRAQYLHGSLAPGGWANLVLPLAIHDLNGYREIDFWAHSDSPTLTIRVSVVTDTVTDDDYFGGDVTIRQTWGEQGSINNAPIVGAALTKSDMTTSATPADLAAATAIAFQFAPPEGASQFGFWIDDVQLKQ
jgi:hypothetical protein